MHSIIKKYTSIVKADEALDKTKFGQKLVQEMLQHLEMSIANSPQISEGLSSLLKMGSLPPEIVNIIIRPWHRATMLIEWCRQCNLPEEKNRVKDKIEEIKQIKKAFTNWPKASLSFMLFLTSTLPDIDNFLFNLEEFQKYLEEFNNISFKRGSEYSPEYFKRYAINSLFWIGKKMGLAETGKPTQLNEFIKIITGNTYGEIGKDHFIFKETNFIEQFNSENTALSFIFDPHCPSTNGILNLMNAKLSKA